MQWTLKYNPSQVSPEVGRTLLWDKNVPSSWGCSTVGSCCQVVIYDSMEAKGQLFNLGVTIYSKRRQTDLEFYTQSIKWVNKDIFRQCKVKSFTSHAPYSKSFWKMKKRQQTKKEEYMIYRKQRLKHRWWETKGLSRVTLKDSKTTTV